MSVWIAVGTILLTVVIFTLFYNKTSKNASGNEEDPVAELKEAAREKWRQIKTLQSIGKETTNRKRRPTLVRMKDLPSYMVEPKCTPTVPEASQCQHLDVSYFMSKITRAFGSLENSIYFELCQATVSKEFPANTVVFEDGDLDNNVYFVQEGLLTMFMELDDGSEVAVKDIEIGETIYSFLSIMEFLTGDDARFHGISVVAMEDSKVLCLPVEALKKIGNERPEFMVALVKMMLTRLQRITFQTLHSFFGLTKELLAVHPGSGGSKQRPKRRSVKSMSNEQIKEERRASIPTPTSATGEQDLKQKRKKFKKSNSVPSKVGARARLHSATGVLPQLSLIEEEEINSRINGIEEVPAVAPMQVLDDEDVLTKAAQQVTKILGLEDENIIKRQIRLLKFQPDVQIASAGSKDRNLVFIASGSLHVTQKIADTDISKTVHVAQPGELLGEMAVMTGEPQQYAIKSGKSETVLALIGKSAIDKIIADHPHVAARISYFVVKKMSSFTRQTDYAIEWHILESGQQLFSQEDDAEAIFIVLNGRLRSVVSGPDGKKHIVEEFGRGDLVGLAEVVAGEKRHSTVHAVRDTEVTKIPKGTLSFIKNKYPATVTSKVIQKVGDRLSVYLSEKPGEPSNFSKHMQRKSNLSTVAVVPISDGVPLSQFSKEVTAALSKIEPSVCLTYNDVIETFGLRAFESIQKFHLTSWMNMQEDQYKIVVYETDKGAKEWTRRCLRQADCILLVGMADQNPGKIDDMETELCSLGLGMERVLVLLHRSTNGKYTNPTRTAEWLNARDWCSSHHHIRCPEKMFLEPKASLQDVDTLQDNDFGRLARYLTGTSVGLVLGGGGARGLSHVGIIKAMKENNIPIDIVGGTSIGSFVGSAYCTDPNMQSLEILARKLCARMSSIWEILLDLTYPHCALFTGRRFNLALKSILGNKQIEDLWLPYFCITTDVTDSKMRVHMDGSLWRYVRSSMSLAGYFPPLCDPKDKHLLLDGGYVNNLPADIMKAMGAQKVFAVDVGGVSDSDFHDFGDELSGFWMLWKKWNPVALKVKVPDLPEIHSRLAYIASNRMLGEVVTSESYHYIRPPIDDFGLTSFDKYEEIRDVGYAKGTQLFSKLQHEDFNDEEKSKDDRETIMRTKIKSVMRTIANLENLYTEDSDNDESE